MKKEVEQVTLYVGQNDYTSHQFKNEGDFQTFLEAHLKEIFGEDSVLVNGVAISSTNGNRSKPDFFVVTYGPVPTWCMVEVELHHHTVPHIVGQATQHLAALGDPTPETRERLVKSFVMVLKGAGTVLSGYNNETDFTYELISHPSVPLLIIDQNKPELKKPLKDRFPEVLVCEVQVFRRRSSNAMAFTFPDLPSGCLICPKCKKPGHLHLKRVRNSIKVPYHYFYVAHWNAIGEERIWHYVGKQLPKDVKFIRATD